jgi:anti-sigma factor RsiW
MKNACAKFEDLLLEAALARTPAATLEEHLRQCPECARELAVLRARRERMDALLPQVAGTAEPSIGFRARVLAAAETASGRNRLQRWRAWALLGATAAVAALAIGLTLQHKAALNVPRGELIAAEKLAEWRAPSDALLDTPGQEILRSTPRLGESYLKVVPGEPLGEMK